MNKYLVEFLGTMFFIYVIIATQNPLAIGAALTIAIMLSKNIEIALIIKKFSLEK